MAPQHKELYLRLDDAEQVRSYAQFVVSKQYALDDALSKARAKSRYWQRKAKEGTKRAMGVEKEWDEAKEDAQIAWLAAVATGDVKTLAEDNLARV